MSLSLEKFMLKHGGFTYYDRKTTGQDSNSKYKYASTNQNYIRFHTTSPIDWLVWFT